MTNELFSPHFDLSTVEISNQVLTGETFSGNRIKKDRKASEKVFLREFPSLKHLIDDDTV